MTCLIFHVWRAASSSKTDCVRVWMSVDTVPPGAVSYETGCRIGPASGKHTAILFHLGQIKIERLRNVTQRVIVFVGNRIEARHRAHLAEGKVLHAVESFADLLLQVI